MKKIYVAIFCFCLTDFFTSLSHSSEKNPAKNTISDQVDEFVREVDGLEGTAGEKFSKDQRRTEEFAEKFIEKVLFFNQKKNKQEMDRPDDIAVCVYHLTKNPRFSKYLRSVVQKKILQHPQKNILEKLLRDGEGIMKGEEPRK